MKRKWTLKNHHRVWIKQTGLFCCYRVCTLRLAVQILCITFAEVTYNERNTEATASVVNTQLTTVTLPGHRGKPRLGS